MNEFTIRFNLHLRYFLFSLLHLKFAYLLECVVSPQLNEQLECETRKVVLGARKPLFRFPVTLLAYFHNAHLQSCQWTQVFVAFDVA